MRTVLLQSLALLSLSFAAGASAASYELDTAHSRFEFRVKHMGLSNVGGQFKVAKGIGTGTFEAKKIVIDSIHIEIDPASVDTNQLKRDEHLRSPDFFDVKKFTTMTFDSKSVTYNAEGIPTKIIGDLFMHGVTKSITLDVEWGGIRKDDEGHEHIGFEARGLINRIEFKMEPRVMIGDDVKLEISVEALKVETPKT